MKLFALVLTVFLLPILSIAGEILPDMSRDKSEINSSPVSAGWSDRRSVGIDVGVNRSTTRSGEREVSSSKEFSVAPYLYYRITPNVAFEGKFEKVDMEDNSSGVGGIYIQKEDNYYYNGKIAGTLLSNRLVFGLEFKKSESKVTDIQDNSEVYILDGTSIHRYFSNQIGGGLGLAVTKKIVVGGGIRSFKKYRTSTNTFWGNSEKLRYESYYFGVGYHGFKKVGENGFSGELSYSYTPKKRKKGALATNEVDEEHDFKMDAFYAQNNWQITGMAVFSFGETYSKSSLSIVYGAMSVLEYQFSTDLFCAGGVGYFNNELIPQTGSSVALMVPVGILKGGYRTDRINVDMSYNLVHSRTGNSYYANNHELSTNLSYFF